TVRLVGPLTRNRRNGRRRSGSGCARDVGRGGDGPYRGFQIKCAPFTLASDAAQGAGSTTHGQGGMAGNSLDRLLCGGGDPCERLSISGLRVEPGENHPLRLAEQSVRVRKRNARRLYFNQRANT